MPLRVKCSAGHLMMVPDHRAGTVLRCAICGIDVQVPPASGTAPKEPAAPRVSAPAVQRSEPRQASGPAARQSPRVAGHSTAPKSGINLPTVGIKKPSLPRTKAPAPADDKRDAEPSQPASAEAVVAPPSEPAPPVVEAPVEFLLPMDVTPPTQPVNKKQPAFEIPAVEPEPPPRRREPEPSPSTPKAKDKPSNRPRMTLTGTMLSPEPEPPPERITSEKRPLPKQPEPEKPEPAKPAARLMETRVEAPREKPAEKSAKIDKPVPKKEPPRQVEAPPLAEPPAPVEPMPTPAEEPAVSAFHAAATIVESHPLPEPEPPPQFVVLGVQPTAAQRLTVWQLAAALLAALLLSIGPSLWEISDYLGSENATSVARWAFLLLMLGVVQFGCILLLVQVPDWSSVWIVTLQSLALSAIYAAVLGLTIITRGDSTLIGVLQLDYQYASGKAPPWCVCLAATYACLAFFAGRISAKWRKVLKQVQATEAAAAHA